MALGPIPGHTFTTLIRLVLNLRPLHKEVFHGDHRVASLEILGEIILVTFLLIMSFELLILDDDLLAVLVEIPDPEVLPILIGHP